MDRYLLVRELGRGGQGAVWQAEDPMEPRTTRALKLVDVAQARHSDLERIRREARALAQLEHSSLVRCHGLFEDLRLGVLGVSMDFVDGRSLAAGSADPRFSNLHRVAALVHVAGALAFVHRQGIVHRDLKAENVLLGSEFFDHPEDPGNLKLVDFGIARVEGEQGLTMLDHVVGTVAYLAPERLVPRFYATELPPTAADVFAWGVLACELFTRTHPTGLPRGSTLSEYAIEYRRAAEAGAPWPIVVPEGPWGDLVRDALALRAEQRILDGQTLVRRCHSAGSLGADSGDFDPKRTLPAAPRALGRTSTPPVDAFAPTQVGTTMGARSSAPPTFDRAPRATVPRSADADAAPTAPAPATVSNGPPPLTAALATVASDAPPRISSIQPEPRSGTPVVLPSSGERVDATGSTSGAAPVPGTPDEPRIRATAGLPMLGAGFLLVALAGVAVVVVFWGEISLLLGGSKARAPLPAVPAVAASAVPIAQAGVDAGDGADAGLVLPTNCDPDAGLCDCCPTNRDCSPGSCDDPLPPEERFTLRLRDVSRDGRSVWHQRTRLAVCFGLDGANLALDTTHPHTDKVCMGLQEVGQPYGGLPQQGLGVSARQLADTGLSVKVFEPKNDAPIADGLAQKFPALTRAALCRGLGVDLTEGDAGIERLEFTLDAPGADPAEKCPERSSP